MSPFYLDFYLVCDKLKPQHPRSSLCVQTPAGCGGGVRFAALSDCAIIAHVAGCYIWRGPRGRLISSARVRRRGPRRMPRVARQPSAPCAGAAGGPRSPFTPPARRRSPTPPEAASRTAVGSKGHSTGRSGVDRSPLSTPLAGWKPWKPGLGSRVRLEQTIGERWGGVRRLPW